MINLFLATALLMAGSSAMAVSPFIWDKRVIVIRADASTNPKLQEQRRLLLADRDALAERDLIVFAVVGDGGVQPVFGTAPSAGSARSLVQMLPSAGDFLVALIGKDGGVKTTSTDPLSLEALVDLIDAMPMRRQEQKK